MNGGNETSWPWYWRSQQDGQHDQIKRNGIDINDGLKRNGRRTYSHWRLGNRSSDVRELSLILLLLRKSRLRLTRPLKALASMCWMSFFDKYLSGDNQIYSTATLFSLLFSLFIYFIFFFFRFEQGKMKRVTYKKRRSFWWRNTSAAIDCMLFCSKCLHFRVDWHQRNPLGRWGGGVHLIQYLHYFQKGVAAEREAADIRYAVVG